MRLDRLENIPVKTITSAFNKAFEEYAINMHRTEEQMTNKILAESINLSMSVGAFDGDDMVGFILFGVDTVNGIKTMWDGGTGVLPKYRGQQLTQKMFEHILPICKQQGVKKILLEVLEGNDTAYRIYEHLGLKKTRKLLAYDGELASSIATKHNVTVLEQYDHDTLLNMGNWQPAWQQMNNRVKGWGDAITTIGIKQGEEVVAYAHYNPTTKRIFQFAVKKEHRRKGMGSALFSYICNQISPVSIVNVDERSTDAIAFLKALGIAHFLDQYEMEMNI